MSFQNQGTTGEQTANRNKVEESSRRSWSLLIAFVDSLLFGLKEILRVFRFQSKDLIVGIGSIFSLEKNRFKKQKDPKDLSSKLEFSIIIFYLLEFTNECYF
jgi:hypothetical protein